MNELKPCPFCGGEAETFEASEDSFSILCTGCGGNQYTSCDTAQEFIYCGHQKLEKMDKLEPEESEE